jgi:beta-lactam-binding protein with PASTA domain
MPSLPRRRLPLAIAVIVASISCSLLPSSTAAGAKAPAWREVVSMRTATSDTFTNGAGGYRTRLYSSPINYRSGRVWKRIDSSLVADGKASSGFENAANSFRVQLKRSLRGSYLHFEAPQGRASFSLSLQGATGARALRRGKNGLSYEEAGSHADFDYQVTPDGLKETIELLDRRSPSSYVFKLLPDRGEQLHAVRARDGSFRFFGRGASKPAFSILAPTVTDSLAETEGAPPAKGMASMSVQRQRDGRFRLELSIDRKWLSDPARTFPVYLDPSITYPTDVMDGFYNYATGQNAGPDMSDHLELGPRPYVGLGDAYDIVINYDLSAIPRGAAVDGDVTAYLYLRVCKTGVRVCGVSGHYSGVLVHALTTSWSSTTPWVNVHYDPTVLAYKYFSGTPSSYSWYSLSDNGGALADKIQSLVGDGTQQGGFLFEASDSQGPSFSFDSYRDGQAPYLLVNWHSVAPSNDEAPTIEGETRDGQTLTAEVGMWSGTWPISYGYQWRRCDQSGGNCADISGATGSTYALTLADVGHTIQVGVRATNSVGSADIAFSDPTDAIDPLSIQNPILPAISGLARDEQVLTGSLGTWTGSGQLHLSYQWVSCEEGQADDDCTPLDSGDVDYPHSPVHYTLTSDQIDQTIELQVTATDEYDSDPVDTASARTAKVTGVAPHATSAPTISGDAVDQSPLTGINGNWGGSTPFTSEDFQWLRCASPSDCSPIEGADSDAYQLQKADIGSLIEFRVTETNDYGSASSTSDPTPVVAALLPANLSPPTITGTAMDTMELRGDKGEWKGTADLSYAYQWRRCNSSGAACADIDGATSDTYDLVKADIDSTIVLRVTATNDYGSAYADSNPTVVVVAAPPRNKKLPTIAGLVRDGVTLTASEGEWEGTAPFAFVFRWRLCDETGALESCHDIEGANATSYTVTTADIGHTIRVEVTASNVTGVDVTATSPATGAAEPEPLTSTALPLVTGSAMVGQNLSSEGGSWKGSPPIDHYFQWLRCDSNGGKCDDIDGATAKSYKVAGPDINHKLRVQEKAANAAGELTVTSEATDSVSPWVSSDSDYAIQLTATPDDVLAAGTVVYEVKVRNSRSDNIYIDHLDVTLPQGFSFVPGSTRGDVTLAPIVDGRTLGWAGVPEVPAGETRSFQFEVQAGGEDGTFTSDLTATVRSLEPVTLSKVAPVTVETEPTMKLKSDVKWVPVGGKATFTATIFNPTPDPLPVAAAKVILPTGLEYQADSASLGAPDITGELLRWNDVPTVPARDQEQFTFTAKSTAAKDLYTVTSQAEIQAVAQTSNAKRIVSKQTPSGPLQAEALLSGEAADSLAHKFRPYLYFDTQEAWRPLNVDNFLNEKSDDYWRQTVWSSFGSNSDYGTTNRVTSQKSCKPITDSDLWDWQWCSPSKAIEYLIDADDDSFAYDAHIDFNNDYSAPDMPRDCPNNATINPNSDSRLCDPDTGNNATYYYHAAQRPEQGNNALYLNYFIFYRYNNAFAPAGADRHEGDWEGLLIKTTPNSSNLSDLPSADPACEEHEIAWAALYAHGTPYKYGCGVLRWAETTHMKAYPAASNHPSYPEPCASNCLLNEPITKTKLGVTVFTYAKERPFGGEVPWGENDPDTCAKDDCLQAITVPNDVTDSEAHKVGKPHWAFWDGNWSGSNPNSEYGVIPASVIVGPAGHYGNDPNKHNNLPTFISPWKIDDIIRQCDRTVFDTNEDFAQLQKDRLADLCTTPIPPSVTAATHAVPKLTGETVDQAKSDLKPLHLELLEKDKTTRSAPKDHIFKQDPKKGTRVAEGYWVTIYVAKRDHVPDVAKMTLASAKGILTGSPHRLKVTGEKQEYDDSVSKGRVTRTDPKAKSEVVPGDKIVIYVSKGPKPVKMPDVIGKAWTSTTTNPDVKALLTEDKYGYEFSVTKKDDYSLSVANNHVIKTDPAKNASTHQGASVTVWVSKGPKPVSMPDVIGKAWTSTTTNPDVKSLLTETKNGYQFKVTEKTDHSLSVANNHVIKTDPTKNASTHQGASVTVWVSKGPQPVRVPSVIGTNWRNAESRLEGDPYHFDVTVTRHIYPADVGDVYDVSPNSGNTIPAGSSVTIKASDGLKDVRGMTPSDAKAILGGAPWHLNFGSDRDGGYTKYGKGTISDTDPAPGASIKPHATIHFYISKGPKSGKALETPPLASSFSGKAEVENAVMYVPPASTAARSRTLQPTRVVLSERESSRSSPERHAPGSAARVTEVDRTVRSTKKTQAEKAQVSSASSASSCDSWFGPLVVALACDEKELDSASAEDFQSGGTFGMTTSVPGTKSAAGPGYAQVLGSPLEPGDSVSLFGTAPKGTRLAIRLSTSDGGTAEDLFKDVGLEKGGRVSLTVKKGSGGIPDAEFHIGNKIERPSTTLVRPGAPQLLSVKQTRKSLRIRFRATASKTGIEIAGKKKQPIASFSLKTRKGTTKQILVPLAGRRPQSVSLTSYGTGDTASSPASATRPSKPYIVALRRTSRGLLIRFEAKVKKTLIKVYSASGKRVSTLTVKAKVGARKELLLRLGRNVRIRSVELVSIGRYGFDSMPVARRVR